MAATRDGSRSCRQGFRRLHHFHRRKTCVPEKNGGKYSKTDFKVLKEIELPDLPGKKAFLIECNLFTGRTHQIRVHLAAKVCFIYFS